MNRLYRARWVAIACLAISVSACSQSEPAGPPEAYLRTDPATEQPNYVSGTPPGGGLLATNDVSDPAFVEASMAYLREAGPRLQEGRLLLASDASPQRKSEGLQSLFAEDMSPAAAWFVKTNLSLAALDVFAAPGAARTVPAEIVAPYVEHLVAVGNPNADVILRGLERLEGIWPEPRVEESAARVTAASSAYLASSCESCWAGDPAVQAGRSDRERDIAEALPRLERMR